MQMQGVSLIVGSTGNVCQIICQELVNYWDSARMGVGSTKHSPELVLYDLGKREGKVLIQSYTKVKIIRFIH